MLSGYREIIYIFHKSLFRIDLRIRAKMKKLISSNGKYAYGENKNTVYCHLFAAGIVNFENGVKIKCKN